MSAARIVQDWRWCVAQHLLPNLHGHQSQALADFSYAAAVAGHCQAGQLASHTPTEARVASSRRRFERLLANARLQPRRLQQQLAHAVMAPWSGRRMLLILDETPKANDLRAMTIRVAYAKRALPLASVEYRPDAPPEPMPDLVKSLLQQVHDCLPPAVDVVLLADRGLAWPTLLDWCQAHHWHYLLRLQGQTKVRDADRGERTVRELVDRPGTCWLGPAEVFKTAGWRVANVVAYWPQEMPEPWLLLSDERATLKHCRVYGQRTWAEESFRDDKSSGFHWGQSRVNDPEHAGRLLVVLALAMLLAASLGTHALKSGHRHEVDPHRSRRLSIIQLGLRWLRFVIDHNRFDLIRLDRIYLYPK
jgi:hypothetical protein